MPALHAIILGLVEGLTEFLPVSSTGHLIIVSHWLGHQGEASAAFDVVVQLGAILAVVVHYRSLLWGHTKGLLKKDPDSIKLLLALILGFIPTAIAGLTLRKTIKSLLFGTQPVAYALIVGGVIMIVIDILSKKNIIKEGETNLSAVTPIKAFLIGVGQCFSLWPGMSRSMSTIVAGRLTGLSTATAAEFSFLLALPTLGAATCYEFYKSRAELLAASDGASSLTIGLVIAFLSAWAVVATFLTILKKAGLIPFGIYRLILGVGLLWWLAS